MHAPWVVVGIVAATVLSGWGFFQRYALARPPIGVINLWDVAFVLAVIVGGGLLNLLLPDWLLAGLLALCALSLLITVAEPMMSSRWRGWLLAGGLVAADLGIWLGWGALSWPFLIVNNLVLLLSIVGIANLWAQGGMRARDLALLAAGLTLYDLGATWQTTLTAELFQRLMRLPFVPLIAWPLDGGQWLGIGVGDMVLATLSPLVLRKAFGQRAGLLALLSNLGLLGLLVCLALRGDQALFPVMVVLGPLIVLHYAIWRWYHGTEGTTLEFRQNMQLAAERRR